VSVIDNLPHDAVVRPAAGAGRYAASVRCKAESSVRKMKETVLFVIIITLVVTCPASGQGKMSKSDQALIEQAIENWNKAWQTKDSKLAAQDYSDDADWTNAFGMKRKGRAEIEKVLAKVFALAFVMSGQSKTLEQSVRFINPDVALVITRVERAGQRVPSEAELGTRQTSHLRVLVKSKGQWKIISLLISDARDTEQR
jgi:uncharacterized protein (TIGR02246 family)